MADRDGRLKEEVFSKEKCLVPDVCADFNIERGGVKCEDPLEEKSAAGYIVGTEVIVEGRQVISQELPKYLVGFVDLNELKGVEGNDCLQI